jgi:hypothetical protein
MNRVISFSCKDKDLIIFIRVIHIFFLINLLAKRRPHIIFLEFFTKQCYCMKLERDDGNKILDLDG